MAISALSVAATGDRSFTASFTSAADTDVVEFSALAALLPAGSTIRSFIAGAPALSAFRSNNVMCGLISSVVSSVVQHDPTGFAGFAAGDHVLRVALSHTVDA